MRIISWTFKYIRW